MTNREAISSIKHPVVAATREALAGRGAGKRAFLAEDAKMVRQALDAGVDVERIFYVVDGLDEEGEALLARARARGAPCHETRKGVFFKILGLGYETACRMAAVVWAGDRPAHEIAAELGPDALVLVGEAIQDPRNVGVLIRTADACGARAILFSADSADPYSRASVRSTTGSIFRVPLALSDNLAQSMDLLKQRAVRVIGTSAHASKTCWEADLSGPCAIVLGNESVGLSERLRGLCDDFVAIPVAGGASSFNVTVAGGVLLYEACRQRARKRPR